MNQKQQAELDKLKKENERLLRVLEAWDEAQRWSDHTGESPHGDQLWARANTLREAIFNGAREPKLLGISAITDELSASIVCGMAFDYGAALGRIEALEEVYHSVDFVLGGAESKGLLRDIWAHLGIKSAPRCTHPRAPQIGDPTNSLPCAWPRCPEGREDAILDVYHHSGARTSYVRIAHPYGNGRVGFHWVVPGTRWLNSEHGGYAVGEVRRVGADVYEVVGLPGPAPPENLQLTPMPAPEEFTILPIPDQHPLSRGTVILRCPRCDAGAFYVMPENARPNVPIWANCNCGHRFDARAATRGGLEPRLIERSVFGDAIRARSERARLVAESIALDPPPSYTGLDDDEDTSEDDD